jgi:hypothetical protein
VLLRQLLSMLNYQHYERQLENLDVLRIPKRFSKIIDGIFKSIDVPYRIYFDLHANSSLFLIMIEEIFRNV